MEDSARGRRLERASAPWMPIAAGLLGRKVHAAARGRLLLCASAPWMLVAARLPSPGRLGPHAYSVSSAVDPTQALPSEQSCFRSTHRPASPQRRPCRLHRHQPVSAAPGAAGSCSGWGFQASGWGFRGAGMFDYYFQVLY